MIQQVIVEKVGDGLYNLTLKFGEKLDGALFQDQVFTKLNTEQMLNKVADLTGTAMHSTDLASLDQQPLIYFGLQK